MKTFLSLVSTLKYKMMKVLSGKTCYIRKWALHRDTYKILTLDIE